MIVKCVGRYQRRLLPNLLTTGLRKFDWQLWVGTGSARFTRSSDTADRRSPTTIHRNTIKVFSCRRKTDIVRSWFYVNPIAERIESAL